MSEELEILQTIQRRRQVRSSLAEWCRFCGFEPAKHHRLLIGELEEVERGDNARLAIFMPPGSAKSTYASVLFPPWFLSRHPASALIAASHTQELATRWGRKVRNLVNEHHRTLNFSLSGDSSAADRWETDAGGEYFAIGVGGALPGRRGDLILIDDPVRSFEDAASETMREKAWEWYITDVRPRRKPGGRIVLIQTRWHEDDLAGRILAQASEPWHVVNMPAVKDSVSITMPQGWSLEEDNRSDGEALCPLRYNEEQLEVIRATVGATTWQALFQQRPTNQEGNLWKRSWFENATFETAPELVNVGYDWDTAYTEDDDNSATAYFKSGIGQDGRIYILDFDFRWTEFPETITWMKGLQGPHYVEKKASGKSIVPMLRKVEVYAAEVPVKGGDKIARTMIATPIVETGRVRFKGSILSRLLDDERQGLLKFPVGSHNDVNDAFVQALNRLYPFTKITVGEHKEKEWWEEVGGAPTNGNGNGSRPPSDWRNAFVV